MRTSGAKKAKEFFEKYGHQTFRFRRGTDQDVTIRENCKLFGGHIKMKTNSNPSDIQWEHKEQTKLSFFCKLWTNGLIALILSVLFFGVITYLKRNSEAA